MPVTTLIPDRLLWSTTQPTREVGSEWARLTFDGIEAADFNRGEYKVCHYSKDQSGEAFGPISLSQTLRFCQVLAKMFSAGQKVVVEHDPGDRASHANTAVVVGAFLILQEGWSLEAVREAMMPQSQLKFVCAWCQKKAEPIMTVADCWHGLQVAEQLRWVMSKSIGDDVTTQLAISQYNQVLFAYDAAWLVPSQVMVMADPMSTIMDPHPTTCSFLTPDERAVTEEYPTPMSPTFVAEPEGRGAFPEPTKEFALKGDGGGGGSARTPGNPKTPGGRWGTPSTSGSRRTPDELVRARTSTSVDSVCKDYDIDSNDIDPSAKPPADLVSFLKRQGVVLVVRMNGSGEPGLRELGGSYNPGTLRQHGLKHKDFYVKDVGGGLPTKEAICDFLELVDSLGMEPLMQQKVVAATRTPAEPIAPTKTINTANPASNDAACLTPTDLCQFPAVAIHCKSGFGRSVIMACLAMIHVYDIPGRALLGWTRIARPGAFTVPAQESFLCQFQGRQDLHSYCHYVAEEAPLQGKALGDQGCCGIQ